MIRFDKMRAVARFEFTSMVLRKGYLITTFGMPLFLLAYGAIIGGVGTVVGKQESQVKIYGAIDRAGILGLTGDTEVEGDIPQEVVSAIESAGQSNILNQALAVAGSSVFRPFESTEAAQEALLAGDIGGYFLIESDYVETGAVDQFMPDKANLSEGKSRRGLRNLLLDKMLEGKLAEDVAKRVHSPISKSTKWTVKNDGTVEERSDIAVIAKLVIPILFMVLFFIALMMSSSYLVQGTAIEKENKVVEVLLSSANPDEILTGKLVGLGAAGLLQVTVWFGMVIAGGLAFATALSAVGIAVPWGAIAIAFGFFIFGYLFLGSLMLGAGSLGSNTRESQQYTIVFTLPTVAPMMFLGIFLSDPHMLLAKIMTWIPFTAPATVILRMTLDPEGIAWWEIAGAFAVLIVSTWFALRFGARLFRVGLLMSGARPKFREIVRQARLNA